MSPLVSIIIPCYNAERFIGETIQSVINQTYTNWELIVINDGATDSSESIIQPFLNDFRIHYFKKKNEGVSVARNTGIEKAKGEYIAFLDADDIWYPNNLKIKIEFLVNNPNFSWVYSDLGAINENGERLPNPAHGKDGNILEDILLWTSEVIPGPCSNIILKRECIESGLRFDSFLSTAADQDFTLYLSKDFKGKYLNEVLWDYRIISTSMSRNIKVMEKDHVYVFSKANKNELFKSNTFKLQCFANLYLILAGSWWVDGKNKLRGIYFISKAILTYPPIFLKLIKKFLH